MEVGVYTECKTGLVANAFNSFTKTVINYKWLKGSLIILAL